MKRLILCIMLCFGLVLPVAAGINPAPTIAEVTTLSRYYPEASPIFMSFRIDNDFLNTWSVLIDQLSDQYGLGFDRTLIEELDNAAGSLPGIGGTFEEVFGAWMGDTAAFGLMSVAELYDDKPQNDNTIPWLIAIEIDDADAALTFWQTALSGNDYIMSSEETGTLFTPPPSQYGLAEPHVLLGSDVLFIAAVGSALPMAEPASPLNESVLFQSTLETLPFDRYDAVFYAQTEPIFSAIADSPQFRLNTPGFAEYFALISAAVPTEGVGFTIFDGNSLVMDIAVPYGDTVIPGQLTDPGTIDPEFLHYLPSGAPVVYHGTNLQQLIEASGESLRTTLDMQSQMATPSPYSQSPIDQFEGGLAQLSTLFRGATNLDPQEDLFRWMDNDFALVMDIADGMRNAVSDSNLNDEFPLDFALLIDATTDPDAAAHAVQQIGNAARVLTQSSPGVNVASEEIGGSTVWVMETFMPDFDTPMELLIGSDEHVFVIGTRHFVQAALAPDGSLNDDEAYAAAVQYTLPDSTFEAFIFGDRLESGLDYALSTLSFGDAQTIRLLLGLFGQSSLSQHYNESVGQARGVLTLRLGE